MKKGIALWLACLILAINLCALGDVGNSFSDSGGSWDSGSSWSASDSSSGDSSDGSFYFDPVMGTVAIVFSAGFVGVIFWLSKREMNQPGKSIDENAMEKILQDDPGFSQENFLSHAKKLFIQLQEAWESHQMEVVRGQLTPAYYETLDAQLNEFRQKGHHNRMEGQEILSAKIAQYKKDEHHSYIVVRLNATVIDFVEDKAGNLVSGDKSQRHDRVYKLVFRRPLGSQTGAPQSIVNCPNCGSPINKNGACSHCGTQLESQDWQLDSYGRF